MTLDVRQNRLLLPAGPRAPEEINVVVEIPSGSRNKYEYDKALDIFMLDRALHSAIFYPGDYGSEATFSGCLVVARPIGLLKMIDGGKEDDKILAVPVGEPDFAEIHNFTQVFSHQLRKISHFFETYKALEGKETQTGPWADASEARRIISESMKRFKDKEGSTNGTSAAGPAPVKALNHS